MSSIQATVDVEPESESVGQLNPTELNACNPKLLLNLQFD
jgi:hypothetical protein